MGAQQVKEPAEPARPGLLPVVVLMLTLVFVRVLMLVLVVPGLTRPPQARKFHDARMPATQRRGPPLRPDRR